MRSSAPAIIVHAVGPLTQSLFGMLEVVRAGAAERFGGNATIGEALTLPDESHSDSRQQFRVTDLLYEMDLKYSDETKGLHLGITEVDLFVPSQSFVLGDASASSRSAVISLARLDPALSGQAGDRRLMQWRAMTEAIFQIGILMGLRPCRKLDCVMAFAGSLQELDRKGSQFCSEHKREVEGKVREEPEASV